MKIYDARAEIIYINKLSETVFHLKIECPEIAKCCYPGQFVMIKVGSNYDPLLRRPFSILKGTSENGTVEIVFKVVGKGTKILSEKRIGDFLYVLGPLGNSFDSKYLSRNYIFISGGIGFPPLLFMAEFLKSRDKEIVFYYGTKSRDEIFFEMEIRELCSKLILTTEDGSYGERGLVSDAFLADINNRKINSDTIILSCGPMPMLKRISNICKEFGYPLNVSLEGVMACGLGICQGCVVRMKQDNDYEYKLVCKDGPVFNADMILWED